MADSLTTKLALAASLKKLMTESPFKKIGIADICGQCKMNRKSFYYHFRDKYDLINWIFDFEFASKQTGNCSNSPWDLFFDVCDYFYRNRTFYCAVFKIEGQNSFKEHFASLCYPVFKECCKSVFKDSELAELQSRLLASMLITVIEQWLFAKDCLPPERFYEAVRTTVKQASLKICDTL